MSVAPETTIVQVDSQSSVRGERTARSRPILCPAELYRPARIARRVRWSVIIGFGCLAAISACSGSEDGRNDEAVARSRDVPAVMPPADQLASFTRVRLALADPPAMAGGTGAQAPEGSFWYRLTSSPSEVVGASSDDSGASMEWYVHATHLLPTHAYRLDLMVDGNTLYSIGSGATDGQGTMTSHGTAVGQFTDEYCVGTATPPMPIAGRHALRLMLKSDGSGSGPASAAGALTDPARSYPCHGNGDGVFEYWLVMRNPITIGAAAAH